jgi:glucokinase
MLIGIEIGGTKLQLVLGDENGNIRQQLKLAVNSARGAEGIRAQIQEALPSLLAKGPVSRVGVGFGGPVNWRQGTIRRSHQIEGWSEFDLGGWIHGLTGLPVRVDNDANVAALGEAQKGAGRGHNPVFYVTLGSGVGGGLSCMVRFTTAQFRVKPRLVTSVWTGAGRAWKRAAPGGPWTRAFAS